MSPRLKRRARAVRQSSCSRPEPWLAANPPTIQMAHVSPVPARQSASVNTRATRGFAPALSCCQTQVHGAGGAPRQAQVFTAGRGMAAFAFPQAGKFMHSCLQDVVPPAGILIPAIPVADIPDRNAICGRNANCGRMQIAALPLHSPARRQHLRLPGGATGAMDRYKMYARLAQRPYLAHLRFEHSCRVLVCPLRGEGVESHVRGGRGRERGGAGWRESTGGAAGRAARTPNMLAAAHSSASSQGGVT